MNILGNLGPEDSDLTSIVTQPLIAQFYVSKQKTCFFGLLKYSSLHYFTLE
jgi:hypothetical protein